MCELLLVCRKRVFGLYDCEASHIKMAWNNWLGKKEQRSGMLNTTFENCWTIFGLSQHSLFGLLMRQKSILGLMQLFANSVRHKSSLSSYLVRHLLGCLVLSARICPATEIVCRHILCAERYKARSWTHKVLRGYGVLLCARGKGKGIAWTSPLARF